MKIYLILPITLVLSCIAMKPSGTISPERITRAQTQENLMRQVMVGIYQRGQVDTQYIQNHILQSQVNIPLGTLLDTKNGEGISLLHAAADKGDYPFMILLIQHGANINIQDNHGNTLVHKAAHNTDEKLLNWCIKNKAIMNIKNKNKKTPRMIANEAIARYRDMQSNKIPLVYYRIANRLLQAEAEPQGDARGNCVIL